MLDSIKPFSMKENLIIFVLGSWLKRKEFFNHIVKLSFVLI